MDRRSFLTAGAGALAFAAWRPHRALASATRGEAVAVVTVDPRIELFNVILYLGDFRGFAGNTPLTTLASPYLDGIEAAFGHFRGHPVVRHYEAMAERGFWLGHPASAMLHLTDPPHLAERIPVNAFTVQMAGGREPLDTFLAQARPFAAESGFMDWFRGQAALHARLVAAYRNRLEWNYVQDLVDYYGDRRESYTLILAPLSHGGGFGPRVLRPDGLYDAFAVVGPRSVQGDLLDFGSGRPMRMLFWHEFSHPHVNHLTDRHLALFMPAVDALQGHLREQVEAYVPWEVHVSDWVSEHVVRGVTTRLAELKVGREEAEAALRHEVQHFPYVGEVSERLLDYETDRARYPTLETFYPGLVEVFEAAAAQLAKASPGRGAHDRTGTASSPGLRVQQSS
jgi:hypothetical protein